MAERDCYTNPNGHDGLRQALGGLVHPVRILDQQRREWGRLDARPAGELNFTRRWAEGAELAVELDVPVSMQVGHVLGHRRGRRHGKPPPGVQNA